MSILWALLAALSFGLADLLLSRPSQEEGSTKTSFYIQLVGALVLFPVLLFEGSTSWVSLVSSSGLFAMLIGAAFTVAGVLLVKAFKEGPLLIVSPITSGFAAVTTMLSLLSGESLAALQGLGIMITIVGIVLSVTVSEDTKGSSRGFLSPGIAYALGTALLLGMVFWLLGFVVRLLGNTLTVFSMRVSAVFLLSLFSLYTKRPLSLKSRSSWKWFIPIGILFTSGTLFYNVGVTQGPTSVTSVITSLYSVVTVLLGYVFLKQRVSRLQTIGIALTLIGIALVSV